MTKTETRGRPRIGKEVTVPIALAVDPKLREALKDEAYRAGKSMSQMGAFAIQRWLNAQKHTRKIEEMRDKENYKEDRNIIQEKNHDLVDEMA